MTKETNTLLSYLYVDSLGTLGECAVRAKTICGHGDATTIDSNMFRLEIFYKTSYISIYCSKK